MTHLGYPVYLLTILAFLLGLPIPKVEPRKNDNRPLANYRLAQVLESKMDLSGVWLSTSGKIWKVSQRENEVTLLNESTRVSLKGTLKGSVISYMDHVVLDTAKSAACQSFVGTAFEFKAKFKLSKDGNRMERKAPDSVSKGSCRLNLKKMPLLVLSRTAKE